MRTTAMEHQLEALRRMNNRDTFALFMEQGTGKTWTLLADAERAYAAGKIDGLLVIAPNGVHINWVRREIPAHCDASIVAGAWRTAAGKRERARLTDRLLRPREPGEPVPLRVLAMSIDAVSTKDGFDFAQRFLRVTRAMIALDESSRIKNPTSLRTNRVMQLRQLAVMARIATGTPVTNGPIDVFSQMEFLESGLLGTTSYRAFVAEYAHLVDPTRLMTPEQLNANKRLNHMQVIARNPDGTKRWRNLDKLQALLEPHSFRVLKRDCLDLPDKIYQTRYFELAADQRRAYDLLREEFMLDLERDGETTLITVSRLSALIKLQQITSGFVMVPGETETAHLRPPGSNPRMDALLDTIADIEGPIIIWARFREELRQIADLLQESRRVVQYHGGVPAAEREQALERFQSGDADVFLGQPQSGGIGLTLTAAQTVIYFSNDFSLETRLQSEDRAHRIGTKSNVVYIDLVAVDTIDEAIVRSLQSKEEVASTILRDVRAASSEER